MVIQALATIKQYQKETDTGGKKRWIFGLLGVILAVVAGAVVYWKLWKQGKELARLRHQQDVIKEQEVQARVKVLLEANSLAKEKLTTKIHNARAEQVIIQNELALLEESTARQRAILSSLQSWEEIDTFIKGE